MYLVSRQRPVRTRRKSHLRPRIHPRAAGPVLRPDHAGAQASRQRRPLAGHPGADPGRRGADAAPVGAAEPDPGRDQPARPGRRAIPSCSRRRCSCATAAVPVRRRLQLRAPDLSDGGGYAGVDDVFRNPPESTAQILHLEKYRGHVKPVDGRPAGPVAGQPRRRLAHDQLERPRRARPAADPDAADRQRARACAARRLGAATAGSCSRRTAARRWSIKTVWDTDERRDATSSSLRPGDAEPLPAAQRRRKRSATRQALTAATAATEVRRNGQNVLVVISFDRPSAEAIVAALGA